MSPQQHPKIRSGSGGALPTLFSQLWDRRDPAPAVLGGRDGSRPARGQQLTPALTAASKTSDRTRWGTQQLRKGGGGDAVRSVNLQMRTLGAGVWPQATRLPAGAWPPGPSPMPGSPPALCLCPSAVLGPPQSSSAATRGGLPAPQHAAPLPPGHIASQHDVWEPHGDKRGRREGDFAEK